MLTHLRLVALDVERLVAARAMHAARLGLDHGRRRHVEWIGFGAAGLEIEELIPSTGELVTRDALEPRDRSWSLRPFGTG